MAAQRPFYITTTLPYVNADPHIGFAFELVEADIVARWQRLMKRDVFFTTGTDEHGQKIFQKAQEEGRDVQEYTDYYAKEFSRLKEGLDLSYDAFIRTTNAEHVKAAQEMWKRCDAKGDIYKKKYKGLYCVGDEMFLRESDLVNGRCPNHPNTDPIEIEEENYFFKLSNYQSKLEAYLSDPLQTMPDSHRKWALDFVTSGLEDLSISRSRERLSWGIPVPGDETQVMYVWFDALTNYISTLGWPKEEGNFSKFWKDGETVQLAGKDQVRFQSVIWQAMLMSADIKNTDKIVYHGFITSGGQKMSKSLGNVIDPFTLIKEYGSDAVRYYLARHVHPFEDSDVTLEHFKEIYNANLANGLGNLVSRIMQLAQTHLEAPVALEYEGYPKEFSDAIEGYNVALACDNMFRRIQALDQEIARTEPYKVVKTDPEKGRELITKMVKELAAIDLMLEPIMPQTSKKIIEAIVANKKPENLFARKD
jgi:methionyl-tRNA synthetase